MENTESKPHVCPVCFGRGLVINGFYSSVVSASNSSYVDGEQCRSCWGTGIVWDNFKIINATKKK